MPFGLGSKHKKAEKVDKKPKAGNSAQADEAAALLKKMEDKKSSGECPFC